MTILYRFWSLLCVALLLAGCAAKLPPIPVDERSIQPGETVTRGGTTSLQLLGTPIRQGDALPAIALVDLNLRRVNLADLKGQVLVVSIVPSVDTQVCERQTHVLGEEGAQLPPAIRRITISRDLPFAQQRFAEETGFADILFLSDFQKSDFGLGTGLLVDQIYLLSRSVMVVDRQGIIRHLQVVPELSHLPDMDKAFRIALQLLGEA